MRGREAQCNGSRVDVGLTTYRAGVLVLPYHGVQYMDPICVSWLYTEGIGRGEHDKHMKVLTHVKLKQHELNWTLAQTKWRLSFGDDETSQP